MDFNETTTRSPLINELQICMGRTHRKKRRNGKHDEKLIFHVSDSAAAQYETVSISRQHYACILFAVGLMSPCYVNNLFENATTHSRTLLVRSSANCILQITVGSLVNQCGTSISASTSSCGFHKTRKCLE